MKSYEEVAKSVFEKSEKYFKDRAERARRIKIAATAMSCFCLAVVLAVGAMAALNSNLTEYPIGGAADGQSISNGENNGSIPDGTTTSFTTTEALTTTPEPITDDNDVITTSEVNSPDNIWQPPGEYFISGSGVINNGSVNIGYLLAYDGALYMSYYSIYGNLYESTGDYAYFGEQFPCEVYSVSGEQDHIALKFDSAIWEYKKLFDCNFDIDGEKFEVVYPFNMNDTDILSVDYGDIVLQTDDFTVYESLRSSGEASETKEYIVDLLPALKRELPTLFSDDETNYGYKWWIALPISDTH